MKLKIIIFASLMYCMPSAAMDTKPTYVQMANKELAMIAQSFKTCFELISDEPIDIYEGIGPLDNVYDRYIRIDNSNHLKPLCSIETVALKHKTIEEKIAQVIKNTNLAPIVWAEHNYNDTPFMMPYLRWNHNVLINLNESIDPIIKELAKQSPYDQKSLSNEALTILDQAAKAKIDAIEKEIAGDVKIKHEQEAELRPVGAVQIQVDHAVHAVEIDAQRKTQEEQAKKIVGSETPNQQFSAAYNSAIAVAGAAIPANAAKPTAQSKDCCIQ